MPTAFQRQIFKAAGVIESKIQVVGEPVDVDFFDPHREGLTPYENIPKKGSSTFVYLSIFKVVKSSCPLFYDATFSCFV